MVETHKGASLSWPRYPQYEISDGRVRPQVPSGSKANQAFWSHTQPYDPIHRADVASNLAKIEKGDTAAVLRFVNRYGLLGFSELDEPEIYGDPLSWFWLHAETLALCLSLKQSVDAEKWNEIERTVSQFPQSVGVEQWKKIQRESPTVGRFPCPIVSFAARNKVHRVAFFPTVAPTRAAVLRQLAAQILCHIINANISTLHPVIEWSESSKIFIQRFPFKALIEAVYWNFGNALQHGVITRCELPTCGRLFLRTDKRQRFCPVGEKGESPCAVLARQRRRRSQPKRKEAKHGSKKRPG